MGLHAADRPEDPSAPSSAASAATDPRIADPPLADPPIADPPLGDPPLGDPPLGDPPLGDPPLGDPPIANPRTMDGGPAGEEPTRLEDEAPDAQTPRRSRRRRLAALGAVLAAALAATVIVLMRSGSSQHASSSGGVPPGDTTTDVTRRTLTESSTVDGTLGYGSAFEVYDRLAGTFTWLPTVGAVIGRGGTLYRLNNLPIALMFGSVPAYRTLKSGVSDGPDVAELNQNLIALGYDPSGAITDENHFGEGTAAAVRRWQKAEGLSETGEVELGRIVFAPSARRVTAVHVALGQDPPGATGATEPSGKAAESNGPPSKEPESEKPASKSPASEKPASKEPASKEPKSKEPKSEEPASKEPKSKEPKSKEPKSKEPKSEEPKSEEPGSKEPESKDPGSGNGAPEVVLTTTSTQQLVQLKVKPEQQQLARIGESAPVSLPGGRTDQGRIIEVGSVAAETEKGGGGGGGGGGEKGGGGEGESATIPVTLALEHPVAHLDEAPVSVELVKSVRHDVLAVPATALTATAGGGYAIQVLEGGRRIELPVTPGMFADGYVQVEGTGLHEGQTVIEAA